MALSTTTNRVSAAGNGATVDFSFPYYFLADGDLVVLITSALGVVTTKTLTTHYTVAGAGVAAGGTVTMLVAPVSGETITIYRDPAITQGLDLVENDSMPAESVEEALDRAAMISQRNKELATRSIRLDDGFSGSFSLTLPTDIDTANTCLVVNAAGDGFDVGPTTTEIVDAEANAVAAAASASAASASASAASTSEGNAATSETNAAASAAAAAANAAAILPYRDVVYITNADSPYTITASQMGSVFHTDCTSGAVTINLPSIAAISADITKSLVIIKTDSSTNKVTVARNGTDTINGDTSLLLEVQYAGANFVSDTDGSPDDWTALKFGASAGGSGGGIAITWKESVSGAVSPLLTSYTTLPEVYRFEDGFSQELTCMIKVPAGFVSGSPIGVKAGIFSGATTGTILMKIEATLTNPGDTIGDETNQATSSNTAIDMAGGSLAGLLQTVDFALSTDGTINSVAVEPNALLTLRIYRDTGTDTADVYLIAGTEEGYVS